MKKTILLFLVSLFVSSFLSSQTVIWVNNDSLSLEDFRNTYSNNIKYNGLDRSLDAYVKSQLLLQEAYKVKLDTTKHIKKLMKFGLYESKNSFLGVKKLKDSLLKLQFSRGQKERKVHVISFPIKKPFSPTDTLLVYKKADNIYKLLKSNKISFEDLSKNTDDSSFVVSAKPISVRVNSVNYLMEDLIFKTKVGYFSKVTKILDSYVIVKVLDEEDSSGTLFLSQIFLSNKTGNEVLINQIYDKLNKGESFEELTLAYSEDKNVRKDNGKLRPISENLIPIFKSEVDKLTPGKFTKPIKVKEGWFIILLRGVVPPCKDYNECLQGLNKELLSSDKKLILDKETVKVGKEKVKDKLLFNKKNLDLVLKVVSKDFFSKKNSDIQLKSNDIIVKLGENKYSQKDLLLTLNNAKKTYPADTNLEMFVSKLLSDVKDSFVLKEMILNLANYDSAYKLFEKQLMKNYMVAKYIEENVRDMAMNDDAAIKGFLKKNQKQYTWPERADVKIYTCENKDIASGVVKMIMNKKSKDDILEKFNKEGTNLKSVFLQSGKINVKHKVFPKNFKVEKGVRLVKAGKNFKVFHIENILAPRHMKLDEVDSDFYNKYKESYLRDYTQKLRQNSKITINQDLINTIK